MIPREERRALPFMKLLYLTFQEDAPLYLGVTRKIRGQQVRV